MLLLLAPAFLMLASFRPWLALALSGALWLAAGLFQIALPNYPEPGFWFINPLSWQFLFNIGMVGMMHVRRGGSIPVNRWLVGARGIVRRGVARLGAQPAVGQGAWLGLPAVLTGFDKTFLSLSRLLHILSVGYLIIAIPAVSKLARRQARPSARHPRQALAAGVHSRHDHRHGGAGDEAGESGRHLL